MRIALIGGGFSAISLLLELVRQASSAQLIVIEKENEIGQGVAYGTSYPWHLLNVRANKMGASVDEPEGFYSWLIDNEATWRQADPAFASIVIHEDAFLPRKLYRLYLAATLDKIKALAKEQGNTVEFIHAAATDLNELDGGRLEVVLAGRGSVIVDKVIITAGVPPIKALPFAESSWRYEPNIWKCDRARLSEQISRTNESSQVFIIGTGLTMVDMVTSLDQLGYRGKIIAFSRHGILPDTQTEHQLAFVDGVESIVKEDRLLFKFQKFRKQLLEIGDVRQLVDALRPHVVEMWQRLSLKDRRRFLKHLFSYWNKYRHRMAPQSARLLEKLREQKRLQILHGTILSIREEEVLEIKCKIDDSVKVYTADYVYNCTGPDFSLSDRRDPLFQSLLKKGYIQPDDLNLGVKVNERFQAAGVLSGRIYAMGSLLFGERFETTSVPDIRTHSKIIAQDLRLRR